MGDRPNVGRSGEHSSTLERLLEGSAAKFREQGYAGTTVRELSEMIGLQNASLYHHITSKEDILYQLCTTTLDEVERVLDEAIVGKADPFLQLQNAALAYLEAALKNRNRHAVMLIEIRSLTESSRKKVVAQRDRSVRKVENLVRRAQRSGKLREDFDAKHITLALFNLLNWSIWWYDPAGTLSPAEIGMMLWAIFSDGAVVRTAVSK
jgi:TetR/AcrR family transcriptional regulator, cholesterol catabolism regulator